MKQTVRQAVALNCWHSVCLMSPNLKTIECRGLPRRMSFFGGGFFPFFFLFGNLALSDN